MSTFFEVLVTTLRKVYEERMDDGTLLAILCHGSALTQHHDRFSDLDLILLTDQRSEAYHDHWELNGVRCDLHVSSLQEAWAICRRDMASNNNLVLDGIARGTVLYQADEAIVALLSFAQQRIKDGPLRPEKHQIRQIRQAALQTILFIEKSEARAHTDPLWKEIASARFGTFLGQLIDSYCRLHQLWSKRFWILLREDDGRYKEIVRYTKSYLTADHQGKRLVLEQLATQIVNDAERQSPLR